MDEMIGKRFTRWLVCEYKGTNKYRAKIYLCKCDCGKQVITKGSLLRSGQSKSCGCLQREELTNRTRKPPGTAGFNSLVATYRMNARNRNLEFDNSEEFLTLFKNITQTNCFYCGVIPSQKTKTHCKTYTQAGKERFTYTYNGLDRIDNTKGYVIGNVVSCCGICNRAKDTMTLDEFKTWIDVVHSRVTKNA